MNIRVYLVSIFFVCSLLPAFGQYSFDGISCWGDSKTQGGYGSGGVSYPEILQTLLDEGGYAIQVFNFGANGERSTEIMQRQGAIPLIVQPFTIPSTTEEVRISLDSRLRVPEAGCNPCTIVGIEGSIRHDWTVGDEKTFYFRRRQEGPSVTVSEPTAVVTDAMRNHRNDVLVLDIGYNGGFRGVEDWINQHKAMIDYSECKEYIVIGRASHYYGPGNFEARFKEVFGPRFINLRAYYVESGLSDACLEATYGDQADMASGIPPRSLFMDEHHENVYGYTLKAQQVFNKLIELNIISQSRGTGISDLRSDRKWDRAIYNLQGQKVPRPTRKGIYIVNGRKVLFDPNTATDIEE